jgi:hypothetical protein
MKKIAITLLVVAFSLFGKAQTKIKYKQMENPATSSVNLGVQTLSTGIIMSNGTVGLGSGAVNTTTMGGLTLAYNTPTSLIHIGKFSATANAIWGYNTSTILTNNYSIAFNETELYINAPSVLKLGTNNTIWASQTTTNSYWRLPLTVGSSVIPTSTLNVEGDMRVTATTNTLGNATLISSSTATTTLPASSGTLANFSDVIFPCQFGINLFSMGGGAVYTITPNSSGVSTFQNKMRIPFNCEVVYCTYYMNVTGTLGSADNSTLQVIANGSLITVTNSFVVSTVTASATHTLNINLNANEDLAFKLSVGGMGTLPTNCQLSVVAWVRRRL